MKNLEDAKAWMLGMNKLFELDGIQEAFQEEECWKILRGG